MFKQVCIILFLTFVTAVVAENEPFGDGCNVDDGFYHVSITENKNGASRTDNTRMPSGCDWKIFNGQSIDYGLDAVHTGKTLVFKIDGANEKNIINVKIESTDVVGYKEHKGFDKYPVTETTVGSKVFSLDNKVNSFDFVIADVDYSLVVTFPELKANKN